MNMEMIKSILLFAGGLGLFIYGMEVMAEGLQKAAGDKTRKLLESLTRNRLMGVLAGALVTAIIQSSSAVTVMIVGFVNASLMNLSQAVGVIMGANIGTTMTAWIVSMGEWAAFLKPDMIAPALLLIGVAMHMFAKSSRIKDAAKILIGFGVLFTGLSSMSGAVKPYTDAPIFSQAFTMLGSNPLLGILTGAVVTAIIQSSSASMGILQTLAAAGAVNWGSAVYIALGQNIGTCVTAMISAASGDTNAKRAAMIHLEFNVIGSILVAAAAGIYFMFVPQMMQAHVNSTALAIFHTAFNVVVTIVLFPFANWLVKLSKVLIPGHKTDSEQDAQLVLDPRLLTMPTAALNAVRSDLDRVSTGCSALIDETRDCLINNKKENEILSQSKELHSACLAIRKYLAKIDRSLTTKAEASRIQQYLLASRDLHQIVNCCVRIADANEEVLEDKKLSETVVENINTLSSLCTHALKEASLRHGISKSTRRDEAMKEYEQIRELVASMRKEELEPDPGHERSTQTTWLTLEAADCYEQIGMRCLRLSDEKTWQKPGMITGLPFPVAENIL
ncbi:Na/Pi cotransporter family protein [Ileibacterium valens]|uniref:Na/Pi cotransporter family protein n=1 Tax=Ileibacterium valens TaxID=1862668 RepID=UPI003518420D